MSLSSVYDDHKEIIHAYTAIFLGTCIGFVACIGLNKVLNEHVTKTCDTRLNQIVTLKTVVGDSYGCVSKTVLHGPSAPLKP